MIKNYKLIILFILLIFTFISCGWPPWKIRYKNGDGDFTDFGTFAGSNRYKLHLGTIDFTKYDKKTFLIGKVPVDLGFSLCFEVKSKIDRDWYRANQESIISHLYNKQWTNTEIYIKVRTLSNNTLYEYRGSLFDDSKYWKENIEWHGLNLGGNCGHISPSMTESLYINENEVGRIFTGHRIIIEIEVTKPMINPKYPLFSKADIKMYGGGWK